MARRLLYIVILTLLLIRTIAIPQRSRQWLTRPTMNHKLRSHTRAEAHLSNSTSGLQQPLTTTSTTHGLLQPIATPTTTTRTRNLLINRNIAVDWPSMRAVVSLEFIKLVGSSPLLCTATIVALSNSNSTAAVLTAPGCLPAATRGTQTANNDWQGKGPIAVTGESSVRAGDLIRTRIGFLTVCSFVWATGVDGGEMAICEVSLDINNVSNVGGLGVARWAEKSGAAKAVKTGDQLSVYGYGPSSVISDEWGALTVGVGAGVLRGARVVATLSAGGSTGAQVPHCGGVLVTSGAILISATAPLVAGEPRFCTSIGSGDAGAPLFSIEDGRLVGVAVSSSGAETTQDNGVTIPILCSEKVTRFTSTAYRDSWIRSTLQRTAPEASKTIPAQECPSLTPSPTSTATVTSTRIIEAVIPPTSTSTVLPSPIPQPATIILPPTNYISIGVSLGTLFCFCCGGCCWLKRIRAKVRDGQAEDTRLRNALTATSTSPITQKKIIRKCPSWYGIDLTYYWRKKEGGEKAEEEAGQVERGDDQKIVKEEPFGGVGGAIKPKHSMRATIPTPLALLRTAQRAERLKQEQNAAIAVTLVACEAVNAAPFSSNVRSLLNGGTSGVVQKRAAASVAVAWMAERQARTANVRAKAMAARQAAEAALSTAPPIIPQLNLSFGDILKQHITTLNNAENIIGVLRPAPRPTRH